MIEVWIRYRVPADGIQTDVKLFSKEEKYTVDELPEAGDQFYAVSQKTGEKQLFICAAPPSDGERPTIIASLKQTPKSD